MRTWRAAWLSIVAVGGLASTAPARVIDLWAKNVSSPNGGWSSAFPANLANFRSNSACPDSGPPDARCFCECSGCTDPSSSSYDFRHARSLQDEPIKLIRGADWNASLMLQPGEHVVSVKANALIRFDENGTTSHQFVLVKLHRPDGQVSQELVSQDWSHSRQAGVNQPPFSGSGQLYCNWPLWNATTDGAELMPYLSDITDFPSFFANSATTVDVRASQCSPALSGCTPSPIEELRVKAIRIRVTTAQCGDGVVDAGEQCDGGECCESNCTFSPDRPCNDDGNPCTVDHCNTVSAACSHPPVGAGAGCTDDGQPCTSDVCDGAGNCTHPPKAQGTTCRAAADACDIAEVCDGSSAACPPDTKQPPGTPCPDDGNQCTTDHCDAAGVCRHDAANVCGDGKVTPGCEECDRGPANCASADMCCDSGCSADCKIVGKCLGSGTCCESTAQCGTNVPCCGDGTLDPGEECDDGNLQNGDCCSDTCHLETTIECVPGCAGVTGPQLFSPATMKAKFIDKGGVGTYALWSINPKGRNGDFNLGFGQTIDPRNEPTRLVVLENNGSNGSRILGDFTVHPSDWTRCTTIPGTDDETCNLTDPTEMLSDQDGVRSARIKEVGNKVKYRFQGKTLAKILKPTSPGQLLRACVFIGDDAGSATLKCQASSNGRSLKCQSVN